MCIFERGRDENVFKLGIMIETLSCTAMSTCLVLTVNVHL